MNKTKDNSDRELITTRIFNYPRKLVFKAWTDPKHLSEWWGPKGFKNTFKKFELKPGGSWSFIMHGPDGSNYDNECVFQEITAPERLVFQHTSAPHFQVTASFKDMSGKTQVVWRMFFESAEDCEAVKKYAVTANEENMDRLENHLYNKMT